MFQISLFLSGPPLTSFRGARTKPLQISMSTSSLSRRKERPSATAGMWLFTPIWGGLDGIKPSDLNDMLDSGFPVETMPFRVIQSIKLRSDGDTENPMFTNYSIEYLHESLSETKVSNPQKAGYVLGVEERDLTVSDLQSLKSASLGRRMRPGGGILYISFISVATENKTFLWGNPVSAKCSTLPSRHDGDFPCFTDPFLTALQCGKVIRKGIGMASTALVSFSLHLIRLAYVCPCLKSAGNIKIFQKLQTVLLMAKRHDEQIDDIAGRNLVRSPYEFIPV